jgi:hypothetical protein
MMYRELTPQEHALVCAAFQRFAKAKAVEGSIVAAADQYHAELADAGIAYTHQGFRVLIANDSERTPLAVSKPR